MGDHLHHNKGLMFSFRYMRMNMDQNKRGSAEIETPDIHTDYMVAPQKMTMDMYMLGFMYAPSDKLTVMLMQNILRKDMDLRTRMDMEFSSSSSGLGDANLAVLYSLWQRNNHTFHVNTSLNLPVGNITSRNDTPMQEDAKLPYPMQLGSGTFDVTFGGTYKGQTPKVSWGVQQLNTIRPGTNSQGYRFGNNHNVNLWTAYRTSNSLSVSMRFNAAIQGGISGSDDDLNPMMVTTANVLNSGFKSVTTFVGFNLSLARISLDNLSFGFEAGLPVYQYFDGIQMAQKNSYNVGVRYSI